MKPLRSFLFASLAVFAMPVRAAETPAVLPELPQPATSFGAALADGWLLYLWRQYRQGPRVQPRVRKGRLLPPQTPRRHRLGKAPRRHCAAHFLAHHARRKNHPPRRNERAQRQGRKNDLYSTDEVMRFDPTTQKWEALPPLPEPRSSHDAVVVGDTLYVGGSWKLEGDDGEGIHATWTKSLLALDLRAPEKGWQTHAQPFQRRAIAAVAQGGKLWFLGGMDSKDEPSRAVDWFEPKTGAWGQGPKLPDGAMAGFGIAGCVAAGKVLASPLSGKISALSADGAKWEEIAQLTPARFFHRLLPMADGRLIAVGGSNRSGHIRALEIISLDPKAGATEATKASALTPSEPRD